MLQQGVGCVAEAGCGQCVVFEVRDACTASGRCAQRVAVGGRVRLLGVVPGQAGGEAGCLAGGLRGGQALAVVMSGGGVEQLGA